MSRKNDVEFQILTKAQDLLFFTNRHCKIRVSEYKDSYLEQVLGNIEKQQSLDGVMNVCKATEISLKSQSKYGFSKNQYNLYGKIMKELAKNIVIHIDQANELDYNYFPQERFNYINQAISEIHLLERYIELCNNEGIVSLEVAKQWTELCGDVRRMTVKWRNSEATRMTNVLRKQKQEDAMIFAEIIEGKSKEIIKEVVAAISAMPKDNNINIEEIDKIDVKSEIEDEPLSFQK